MAESASDDFFANLIADVRFSDAQMSKKQKKNKNKKSQKMKGNGWTSKPLSPPTASPAAPSDSTLKKKQKKGPSGPNLLRNAIKNSSGGATGTAAERKANELWFRKANYGEVLFTRYYKGQTRGIIVGCGDESLPPGASKKEKKRRRRREEGEFNDFIACLKTPLPITFRIRSSLPPSKKSSLVSTLSSKINLRPVSYDPSSHFFQCSDDINKASISKRGDKHDSPEAFFLRSGLSDGTLARQEVVSMFPVLALQVQEGDSCLDLCASPGSKTMQLLETVSSGGLVVANDIHPGRVSALHDAIVGRSGLPSRILSRLVIGCHDGSTFPKPAGRGFDRVLTDVPCSGDGTIRKDGSIMPRWNPSISNGLHPIQVEIAWRGLELLKVGGTMAYSTCTFNPIEDEAVVQELVRRGEGAIEVVEWPADVLPGLKKRAGRVKWRVAEHVEGGEDNEEEVDIRWHDGGVEAGKAAGMSGAVESLWPAEGNSGYGLEKCCRFLPQDQNTGGFFVALLKKTRKVAAGVAAAGGGVDKKKKKKKRPHEDGAGKEGGGDGEPITEKRMLPIDERALKRLEGMNWQVSMADLRKRLWVAEKDKSSVVLVPTKLYDLYGKELVEVGELGGEVSLVGNLNAHHVGVKVLERKDDSLEYKIVDMEVLRSEELII